MKPTKEQLLFLPLGGSGEIGMNLNLYGHDGKWLMVDCGITFMDEMGIEVAMPDPAFLSHNKDKIVGLVVTHGHEDHIGAIPHLWPYFEKPIYATPFTAFLIREKLKEAGLLHAAKVIEIKPGTPLNLHSFAINYMPITHSIPEAHVLSITTDLGTIVHTGDWKLDDDPLVGAVTEVEALKKLGKEGVLALVCDSTNVFEEGRSGSEIEVRSSLVELIKKQPGRVAIACFASNVARLATAYEAAKTTGRQVVIAGRSLQRMDQAARYAGYFKHIPPFLKEDALANLEPRKVLLVCTGSQGEPRSALARIAEGSHPRIRLAAGDTVIFSSRIIPGNEDKIQLMHDQLIDRGLIVITDEDDFTHVSGHPYQGELKDMYSWTKPQLLIPVHGERAHLREHAAFGLECGVPASFAPRNGQILDISSGQVQIVEERAVGRVGLDGVQLVPLKSKEIKQRHKLYQAGAIFVSLVPKGKNKQISYELTCVGVSSEHEQETLRNTIEDTILQTLYYLQEKEELLRPEKVAEVVRNAIRRDIATIRGKKPMVTVHAF